MPDMQKLVIAVLALSIFASGATKRSSRARYDFRKSNPCPSTGKVKGACPGYVVDHVTPLCLNGPDKPSNMQWQTVEDAKRKDVIEKRQCRKK